MVRLASQQTQGFNPLSFHMQGLHGSDTTYQGPHGVLPRQWRLLAHPGMWPLSLVSGIRETRDSSFSPANPPSTRHIHHKQDTACSLHATAPDLGAC